MHNFSHKCSASISYKIHIILQFGVDDIFRYRPTTHVIQSMMNGGKEVATRCVTQLQFSVPHQEIIKKSSGI